LRSTIQIEGIPLHVIDTAGLRETDDEVERIGIERTWREIGRADVVLLLADARTGISDADRVILDRLPAKLPRITVYNKIDLAGRTPERHEEHDTHGDAVAISLSAKEGSGIDLLRAELLRVAGWHPAEDVFIARERHLRALAAAQERVAAARGVVEGPQPALELFAEELRLAQHALGEITGEFTADDLLGAIFSRFCIGK
jgi:tRNA modification GTPase